MDRKRPVVFVSLTLVVVSLSLTHSFSPSHDGSPSHSSSPPLTVSLSLGVSMTHSLILPLRYTMGFSDTLFVPPPPHCLSFTRCLVLPHYNSLVLPHTRCLSLTRCLSHYDSPDVSPLTRSIYLTLSHSHPLTHSLALSLSFPSPPHSMALSHWFSLTLVLSHTRSLSLSLIPYSPVIPSLNDSLTHSLSLSHSLVVSHWVVSLAHSLVLSSTQWLSLILPVPRTHFLSPLLAISSTTRTLPSPPLTHYLSIYLSISLSRVVL